MENEGKFDPKSLSKPIGAVEEKTSWLDRLFSPKKKITFDKSEEPTSPKPAIGDQSIPIANENQSNQGFFKNKEEDSWPPEPGERMEVESKTSVRWIIAGSLTVVVLVVVILASFGLVNMIRDNVKERSLSNIEQRIKQAGELIEQGELTEAKIEVQEILSDDANNQKADELLGEINRQIGEALIANLLTYPEIDLSDWDHETYVGLNQHFSVGNESDWEMIDSNYDIKFDIGDSTLGIRSIPEVKSMVEAQSIYSENTKLDKYEIINQREDIKINNIQAKILIAENESNYLVTALIQKHYFAYEISGALDKKDFLDDMESLKKFLGSFVLLDEFNIETYDNLAAFTDTNFVFYAWPNTLSVEDKEYIKSQFVNSYQSITNQIGMDLDENINVYLYPDWETLREYTLADNSFSKKNNNEMHIVFISQSEHQSFGYETTKLIIQNRIEHSIEPIALEGLATTLDQTGRDYPELVRNSEYIPIEQLLGVNWELASGDVKYFVAGTFAQYLIDRYGIDSYINLLKSDQFPIAYENNYSLTLSELESGYKEALGL